MRLPESFLAGIKQRVSIRARVASRVHLRRSGAAWSGLCPFHNEKTPSFYVYEGEDPHFHCYGCGMHGDVIAFVQQAEKLEFREAVAKLAAEVGLEVPEPTPEVAEAEDRRTVLLRALATAADIYQSRLWASARAEPLAYLRGRGLTDETIRAYGLGWTGDGSGLDREIGVERDVLVEAGLFTRGQDDAPSRPFFFGRIMFPIRDRRGTVIGFSGRRLDDGKPKYLNGPETTFFRKSEVLYGIDKTAPAALAGASIHLVEGQMDVIQAHQAGFNGAVAALGTAVTEAHFQTLWRLSPTPTLCFDGDEAGRRAGKRTMEAALPHLTPERTLRVASLPRGRDPDGILRDDGPAAWGHVIESAARLEDSLYDALAPDDPSTPEARAAWRTRLEDAAKSINHRALRVEFRRALLDRFFSARRQPSPRHRPIPKSDNVGTAERARALVAILITHPDLIPETEWSFCGLELPMPWRSLQSGILERYTEGMDQAALIAALGEAGLAPFVYQALDSSQLPLPCCAQPDSSLEDASEGWWALCTLMSRDELERQVDQASRDFSEKPTEATQRRLILLRSHLISVQMGIVA